MIRRSISPITNWVVSSIVVMIFVIGSAWMLAPAVYPPTEPEPVAAVVSGGYRLLALRFPKLVDSTEQEQITVYEDASVLDQPRLVARGPVDERQATIYDYSRIQLSSSQWQAIDQVRNRWCQAPPHVRALASPNVSYEVGIACGVWNQKSFRIPWEELPIELKQLIALIPPVS